MESLLQNPVPTLEVVMVAVGGIACLFPERLLRLFGALAFIGAEFAILFGIVSHLMDNNATIVDLAWAVFFFVTLFLAVFIRSHLPRKADEDDPDDNIVHADYSAID